jgi:hypothetical protein
MPKFTSPKPWLYDGSVSPEPTPFKYRALLVR